MLMFYGVSDDLVEVEGSFEEEYNTDSGKFLVEDSTGSAFVTVNYGANGCWSVGHGQVEEDVDTPKAEIFTDGYSSYIKLHTSDDAKVTQV